MAGFYLSPLQERLIRLSSGRVRTFSSWILLEVEGRLDVEKVKAAVDAVVEDHEILRTNFRPGTSSRSGAQIVEDVLSPEVKVIELPQDVESHGGALIQEQVRAACDFGSDLGTGPALRVWILRPKAANSLMLLAVRSLNCDGMRLANIVEAMGQRWGHVGPAQGSVLQYADIAQGLRELDDSEAGGEGGSTDLSWLQKADPPKARGSRARRILAPELLASVQAFCEEAGVGRRSVLLAAWTLLLWRLNGGRDPGMAVLGNGPCLEELQGLPGPFAGYFPFPSGCSSEMTFAEIAASVGHRFAQALTRQETYVADDELRFAATFEHRSLPGPFMLGGTRLVAIDGGSEMDDPTIRLVVTDQAKEVHIDLLASPEVESSAIEVLADRFCGFLAAAISQASAPTMTLSVLTPDEQQRLVIDLNLTDRDFPEDHSVLSMIDRRAEETPTAPAVKHGDTVLRYGDLQRSAARLAGNLRTGGVRRGDLVGICLERSCDLVVAVLAVLKAGAAYVPLDPGYPAERLSFMVEDSGASFLLTCEALRDRLPSSGPRLLTIDSAPLAGDAIGTEELLPSIANDDVAYVIYTSGSTGRPKGVVITHRGLALSNLGRIEAYGEPVGRFLLLSSFSFDSSLVGIFWTLCTGGCLVLVDEELQKDPARLIRTIEEESISHVLTLPTFWGLILESCTTVSSLDELTTVIVAGEACPLGVVDAHWRLVPGARLYSEYGATETAIFATVYDCQEQTQRTSPLGRPIANAQMYVLDSALQPVPPGVMGEVYFGGPALSTGYLDRPDLTAEGFVPDPFSSVPGSRLYRAGDLARYRPDDELEFCGRVDNQFKIRGYRVELEEIESVLSEHPEVRRAAIVTYSPTNTVSGEGGERERAPGDLRLAGFFETATGGEIESTEVREYLLGKLPDYMVPGWLERLERLPTTPTGKIDRHALPRPGASRSPGGESVTQGMSDKERLLASLWEQVLGVDRVGLDDNYFEMGGDSILSIAIVSRARDAGLNLSPIQVFEHQTVRELASSLEPDREIRADQGVVSGSVPLTPIQHWFCGLPIENRNHWNMPLLAELPPATSREHLAEAAHAVSVHHDAMRLRLRRDGSSWRLWIAESEPEPTIDTLTLPEGFSVANWRAETDLARAVNHGLDMESGPLSRMWLLEPAQGAPLLFWNVHHLAVDLVSWGILMHDLDMALDQLASGRAVRLPLKTTSFKSWAEALQRYGRTAEVAGELSFWLSQLQASDRSLPLDQGSEKENMESSVAYVAVALTEEETTALLKEIPRVCGGHVTDALLAALVEVVGEWSDQETVLIEVEGHGREERIEDGLDLSRTVGWFTTSYPICLDRSSSDPLAAVAEIRARFEAVPGRGLGYGVLRYGARNSDLLGCPAPQVNFNYMGRFARSTAQDSGSRVVGDDLYYGGDRDPAAQRPQVLEVGAWIVDGRLRTTWSYSSNLHLRATIEMLASRHADRLRNMVHLLSQKGAERLGDEFGWDRSDVSSIAAAIERARSRA